MHMHVLLHTYTDAPTSYNKHMRVCVCVCVTEGHRK